MGILRSLAKKVLGKSESARAPAVAPVSPSVPSSGPSSGSVTEKPWYLDGTNDGWDTTDVTSEPAESGTPKGS
jgi:hypothetical protein